MTDHTPLSPEEIQTFLADLDDIDEQEGVSSLLTESCRRALLDLKAYREALQGLLDDCDTEANRLSVINARAALAGGRKEWGGE